MQSTTSIIYTCQPPRSGGTLFIRLLDGHPDVHTFPIPFSFGTPNFIFPTLDELNFEPKTSFFGPLEPMRLDKFHERGIAKKSSNSYQKKYEFLFDGAEFANKFVEYYRKDFEKSSIVHYFFEQIFSNWVNYVDRSARKKFVCGQNTLWKPEFYEQNFYNFSTLFPDGFMVFIARDPKDWLASAVRLETGSHYNGFLEQMLNEYSLYYGAARNLFNKGNFIVLKFEDIVLKTEATMKMFCQMTNVDWSETTLRTTFNGEPFFQNSSFAVEKSDKPDRSAIGRGKIIDGCDVPRAIYDKYYAVRSMAVSIE